MKVTDHSDNQRTGREPDVNRECRCGYSQQPLWGPVLWVGPVRSVDVMYLSQ